MRKARTRQKTERGELLSSPSTAATTGTRCSRRRAEKEALSRRSKIGIVASLGMMGHSKPYRRRSSATGVVTADPLSSPCQRQSARSADGTVRASASSPNLRQFQWIAGESLLYIRNAISQHPPSRREAALCFNPKPAESDQTVEGQSVGETVQANAEVLSHVWG